MLCIHLKETDPWFCLAAEEFLLKNYQEDIFMIWQSEDTVVAGKHQNMMGEINYRYVREHGIRLARRISGGGTVFHDRGNVNFTCIKSVSGPQEISFSRFTEPVREALRELGVHAVTSGRNDLLVEGKKVSGNAEHVYKNRVLHHGTLLFNADLAALGHAIRVVPGAYQGKAVQSNRSTVANIAEFLPAVMTTGEFIAHLLHSRLRQDPESLMAELPHAEQREISRIAEEKFHTREWTFFYSPAYVFTRTTSLPAGEITVHLQVEKGMITAAHLETPFLTLAARGEVARALSGLPHLYEEVADTLAGCGLTPDDDLVYAFF